jgi:uncharacterized damage-inducible protein DinB
MKDVLEALAEYNAKADLAMLGILDGLPAGRLDEETGTYFRTLHGTVAHLAWAGALWLRRFASFGDWKTAKAAFAGRGLDALKAEAKADWKAARALLVESDGHLRALVAEIGDGELRRRAAYKTTEGEPRERMVWHALVQVLNHGTHHRGEVSATLDRMGVANDFNSFVDYFA